MAKGTGQKRAKQKGRQSEVGDGNPARALGSRLRQRIEAMGISRNEVARRLDIDTTRFNHYVNGRHRPSFEMLVKICLVLEVTPGQLLGLEAMPAPPGPSAPREAWLEDLTRYARLLSDTELRLAIRTIKAMHRILRDVEEGV